MSGDQQWLLRTRGQEPWQVVRFDLAANPSGAGPGQGVDLQAGAQQSPGRRLEHQRALLLRLRAAQPARGAQAATLDRRDLLELAAMGYGGDEDGGDTGQDHERLPLDGGVWSDD